MSRTETVTLTNMCMVTDARGNVLVQDRADKNWPGLVFPGGHVEAGESFTESVIREVYEETGITVIEPRLCGVKQFQNSEGRYIVFLYKADKFSGEIKSSDEGEAQWVSLQDFDKLNWVRDFSDMLTIFLDDEISEIRYFREDGELKHIYY